MDAQDFRALAQRCRDLLRIAVRSEVKEQLRQWTEDFEDEAEARVDALAVHAETAEGVARRRPSSQNSLRSRKGGAGIFHGFALLVAALSDLPHIPGGPLHALAKARSGRRVARFRSKKDAANAFF